MRQAAESSGAKNETANCLSRNLALVDYFTLAFGSMVGVGWLVVMNDWLTRGGPLGALFGFVIGGILLLPVGYVYGRLVRIIPNSGSEIAYTERVFNPIVSFLSGWIMMLSYLIVCPWEAVSIGRIMSNIFPGLNTLEIYSIGHHPVYLPNLLIGLVLTGIITCINYRGVRFSAKFQNWTTLGLLSLSAVVVAFALKKGKGENLLPAFSHSTVVSTLLVIQIVPYFMCGFESVTKSAEEANPRFKHRDFMKAILAGILVGLAFYSAMIFMVSYSSPWKESAKHDLAPAYALEQALHSQWIVQLIMVAALFSLVKIFNGNFLAATRLLFALGRRKMIYPRLADIHPRNRTPSVAIATTGIVTALSALFGNSVLIPIAEVGSFAAACGFLATCSAYLWIEPTPLLSRRIIAALGISVSGAIVAMKLLPFIPGHFTRVEWLASLLWIAVGLLLHRREARLINAVGSTEIAQ